MPESAILFETDEVLAERIRRATVELRLVTSRRRCLELADELDQVARILDPAGGSE